MTIRDMVQERRKKMLDDMPPAAARQMLVEFTALYGSCLDAVRAADHAYALVLLQHLDSGEPANRARIRAATSPEYQRKREADDTTALVLESIRSLKTMLRSLDNEMGLAR